MSNSLEGLRALSTYQRLLQIAESDGISSTMRRVYDGAGDASALSLSTTGARVDGDLTVDGTASIPYQPPGGASRFIAAHLDEDARHVTGYGVDSTGATDCTAAIKAILEMGGSWYFPEGSYLIARPAPAPAGAASGGVRAFLTSSLRVVCHPKARFFTDDLDAEMIRLMVPDGGVGLPAEKITVAWYGGYFDQTEQRVSTSVPNIVRFPPPTGKAGSSAITNAIGFNFGYTDGGGIVQAGSRLTIIDGIETYAGEHWQVAGGDAGINVGGGSLLTVIRNTRHTGARDLAYYLNGHPTNPDAYRYIVENVQIKNCMFGIGLKRSGRLISIRNTQFENVVVGFALSALSGEVVGASLRDCNFDGFEYAVNAGLSDGIRASGNQFATMGATLADGVTAVNYYGTSSRCYNLSGVSYSTISDDFLRTTKLSGYNTFEGIRLANSSNNTVTDWTSVDLDDCLIETGTSNSNTVRNVVNLGTVGNRTPTIIGIQTRQTPYGTEPVKVAHEPAGRYVMFDRPWSASGTSAVAANDTLYLYQFTLHRPILMNRFFVYVVTGAAGSSVKAAIWKAGASGYAEGVPVVAMNDTRACDTSATALSWTVAEDVLYAGTYWIGTVFTASGSRPVMAQIETPDPQIRQNTDAAVFTAPRVGYSVPCTFANDIATLDVTALSRTYVGATSGVPLMGLRPGP